MFLADDVSTYWTVTFDQDAVLVNLAYNGIYFLSGMDCDADGNTYAVCYSGGFYGVDQTTGIVTYLYYCVPLNSCTYDTSSFTWYASGYDSSYIDSLFTLDVGSGNTYFIGHYGISNIMISIMCDTYGNMYGYDVLFGGNSHLYTIDKSTGGIIDSKDMGHNFCYAQEGRFDRNYGDNTLWLAAYDIGQGQSYLATCNVDDGSVTIINIFNPMDEIDALCIPYILTVYPDDVGVKKIKTPVSGNAGIISPEITVRNYGSNDEYFPTEVQISKKVYSNYLLEDFEGGSFPPAGWTVQTIFGGNWHTNDYYGDVNNINTGICAEISMPHEQNAPTLTLLTTPSMDLSAVPGAILDCDSWEYAYYYDFFLIDISTDGGVSWNNLYKVSQTYEYGTLHHIQKDLSAYAGFSDVKLRFGFFSAYTWEPSVWQIDNVMVRSYVWNLEYDQTQWSFLGAGQTENLTYNSPSWTPADMGVSENVNLEYKCDATTLLYGDMQTANDAKEKLFNLHYGYFHDVAITGIPSPNSGLAQTMPVQVSLSNNGQNAEGVSVDVQIGKIGSQTTIYSEDFSGGVMPSGWGTTDPSNWYVSYDNYAGGVAPELLFNWYPEIVTTGSMTHTGPIDTTGYTALQLNFKQYVNDYNSNYNLYVWQSNDGGATWYTIYSQAGGAYGPGTTQVSFTGGSSQLELAWVFVGDSFNINYWYIDDVQIVAPAINVEYDHSTFVTMNPGDTLTASLVDWTPADLPLGSIDYVVTATATLSGMTTIGTYGFEDYVPGSGTTWPPTGYAIYDNDYDGDTWWQMAGSSYYCHSGSYDMYTYDYSAEDNWFVSPLITVPGDGGAGFGAYMTGWWGSYGHTCEFWFCPYGQDPSTMLSTGTYLGSAYVWGTYWNWQYYGVSTASVAGQTGYFAIRDTSYYAYDYFWVDDIQYPDGTVNTFEPVAGYFPGWTSDPLVGAYNWDGTSYVSAPPYNYPHTGNYMAFYPDWSAYYGDEARLESNSPTDLSTLGYDQYQGSFWMWQDNQYSYYTTDYLQPQVYDVNNPGAGWQNVGAPVYRYDPSNPGSWVQYSFDLTPYATTQVYFGFLAYSGYGPDISIDDLALIGFGAVADGNPGDNVLSKMITLSYEHDVGIDSILPPAKEAKGADLLWDNGVHTAQALSSQLDTAYPFNSQVADDFQLAAAQEITEVSFDGMFWNGNAENPIDLNVIFYADDGSGNQPTGAGMDDPTSTALFVELHTGVTGTDNGDGTYNYHIVLNSPFVAQANTKYWFVSQWVGTFPPQWGCCVSSTQQLHDCMQGFPLLGYTYWTDPGYGDVSFQLFGGTPPPQGTYPPGTYSLGAVVKNFGVTFTESNIPVEARITFLTNNSVIYDQTGTFAGPLAPGASGTQTFPDFTLQNYTAWEGKYKIEVWTSLPGDDHPNNDKKTMTITMAIPDVIPPITTETMTGTMGLNGWYVSNVVITLTATDPFPPMKFDPKPPSGVNHTYYKLHSGDAWTEYTAPVTVTVDGQYQLYYYSVDKAGNVEPQNGPVNFKIDKTAPLFITFTATAMNVMKTKWLLNATLSDPASGVARVEFYVDDQLVGNDTDGSDGWSFVYQGNGKMAQAIAYDAAGNSAMSDQIASFSLALGQSQSMNDMVSGQTLQLK